MIKKAAILAAGEGSRLKSVGTYKPIIKINKRPLIEIMLLNLAQLKIKKTLIIFNEDEKKMDLSEVPSLKLPNIEYFFKSTKSSLHSLQEINHKLKVKENEHYFISMVDSIILPNEIFRFFTFCQSLTKEESAIIATPFIDDESPLTLEINEQGYITEFQTPIDGNTLVTSGVYCFSGTLNKLMEKLISDGNTKMRFFLTEAINQNHKIRVFQSKKTLDIDRPEDIKIAEIFLSENL